MDPPKYGRIKMESPSSPSLIPQTTLNIWICQWTFKFNHTPALVRKKTKKSILPLAKKINMEIGLVYKSTILGVGIEKSILSRMKAWELTLKVSELKVLFQMSIITELSSWHLGKVWKTGRNWWSSIVVRTPKEPTQSGKPELGTEKNILIPTFRG